MPLSEQSVPLLDQVAFALQALRTRGGLRSDMLLRVDNTAEAAAAPYQFDAASGRLHRSGCRAIPADAPLYGWWRVTNDDLTVACKRCRPLPEETTPSESADRAELLLGVVSLVSQFSSVLKERGKDYQNTDEGRALTAQLGAIYRNLGRREKEVVDGMLSTLDAVIARVRALDRSLNSNGADRKG
jgi:hypothetical protein